MTRTDRITLRFPVPDYDVALLRLEQPLEFDEEVSAICLAGSLNLAGVHATVTRWGSGNENYAKQTVNRIRETQVRDVRHVLRT